MKQKVYRIITNGKVFRVQKQGWFGTWSTLGGDHIYCGFRYMEFETREDAERYIASVNQPDPKPFWVQA